MALGPSQFRYGDVTFELGVSLQGSCQRFKSPVAGDATTQDYKAFCVKLTFDDEAYIAGEYTFELAEVAKAAFACLEVAAAAQPCIPGIGNNLALSAKPFP